MLVDEATYRRITGDTATLSASVTEALTEAQNRVEEAIDRRGLLETATRTETVRIYNQIATYLFLAGRAYPRATPVTSVVSPAGVSIAPGNAEIRGLTGITLDIVTDYINDYPETTVTYTGGYAAYAGASDDTATTTDPAASVPLPYTLARAIALVARELLRVPTTVASGARSATVNGVSVIYEHAQTPNSAIDAIVMAPEVQRYKRRRPMR